MTTEKPAVLILMGSDSDLPSIQPCMDHLEKFGICYEIEVTSAHRSPERTHKITVEAAPRGIKIIIAAAGAAAHLAGVVASDTHLPVIGVPIDSSPLKGIDALYSTVQMPSGIPVATMAMGSAGAANAAVFAARILALTDEGIRTKLLNFKEELSLKVEEKSASLKANLKK
jgi:phosphoribosylaminoimidazole carboxylase PurE protein